MSPHRTTSYLSLNLCKKYHIFVPLWTHNKFVNASLELQVTPLCLVLTSSTGFVSSCFETSPIDHLTLVAGWSPFRPMPPIHRLFITINQCSIRRNGTTVSFFTFAFIKIPNLTHVGEDALPCSWRSTKTGGWKWTLTLGRHFRHFWKKKEN